MRSDGLGTILCFLLICISQDVHADLEEKDVRHVRHVDGHGHDPTE
jgi:hypothetical protein